MHLPWVFFYLHFSLEIQKSAMAPHARSNRHKRRNKALT